jgi:hypothetical protein
MHELNQRGVWARLYEVELDGVSNTLYLTDNPTELPLDGRSYRPYPIKLQSMTESGEESNVEFEIYVTNIDGLIINELENDNILSRKVKIIFVFISHDTGIINRAFDISSEILSATADVDSAVIVFKLGRFNLFDIKLPNNLWIDSRCEHVYRSEGRCHYGKDEFEGTTELDIKAGGDGDKFQGWKLLRSANLTSSDINITELSHLTIVTPDAVAEMNGSTATFTSPFLYNIITNENGSSTDVDIHLKSGLNDISSNGLEGILITDDFDTPETYVYIARKGSSSGDIKIVTAGWNTGANFADDPGNAGAQRFLRIKKVGHSFEFFYRDGEDDNWVMFYNKTWALFEEDDPIRIGVFVETQGTGFTSKLDYFRMEEGGFATCPRLLSSCSERSNTRRFGGAPGILHGPIKF